MADPTTDTIVRLFREFGVLGPIKELMPRGADEAIFLVTAEGSRSIRERDLTVALQALLGRKVWVTIDGGAWESKKTCAIG